MLSSRISALTCFTLAFTGLTLMSNTSRIPSLRFPTRNSRSIRLLGTRGDASFQSPLRSRTTRSGPERIKVLPLMGLLAGSITLSGGHGTGAAWSKLFIERYGFTNATDAADYLVKKGMPFREAHAVVGRLVLHCIKEDKALLEMFYGERAKISTDRDHYDYIYSREKLCTLAGKKLHAKRNYINRFKTGNWSYEPITQANLPDCRVMQQEWCKTNNCCTDADKRDECCAVQQAFRHFDELGFTGGCLRQDGQVVAYTIGEPLNSNTFIVHIEKAFADIPGAYPMINQQFVEHAMKDFEYVNREDDVGDEGLRKAKLSYYPERLLEDYIVEIG